MARRARTWLRLVLIGGPLSFAWEMFQAPGFTGMPPGWVAATARCALAALGDAVILLGLFDLAGLVFRDARWFVPPRLAPYALVALGGVAVQVPLEWVMVHRFGRWGYSALQPVLPLVDVGLFPVLQAVVVPPLAFLAAGVEGVAIEDGPAALTRRGRVGMATTRMELPVQGMNCASCVARIENGLRAVPGVHEATVNLAASGRP